MAGCGQPPPSAASSAANPVGFSDVSGASDCARQTFGICKGSNMVRCLDHALRSLRAELISDHSVYERPEELAEGVRGRSSNPRVSASGSRKTLVHVMHAYSDNVPTVVSASRERTT